MGPIEIIYKNDEGLSSLNSFSVIGGISWGTIKVPFTELDFSFKKKKEAFGETFAIANNHRSSKDFYQNFYSGLPSFERDKFRTSPKPIERNVKGFVLGIDLLKGGDAISGVVKGEGIVKGLGGKIVAEIRDVIDKALGSIGLDASQVSTTSDGLVYGKNGADTYNMDINRLISDDVNICLVQAGIGALVGTAVNIIFFGNFPTYDQFKASDSRTYYSMLNPLEFLFPISGYMTMSIRRSFAFSILSDAATGLILPNMQFQVISNV